VKTVGLYMTMISVWWLPQLEWFIMYYIITMHCPQHKMFYHCFCSLPYSQYFSMDNSHCSVNMCESEG